MTAPLTHKSFGSFNYVLQNRTGRSTRYFAIRFLGIVSKRKQQLIPPRLSSSTSSLFTRNENRKEGQLFGNDNAIAATCHVKRRSKRQYMIPMIMNELLCDKETRR
jgi:hypothetical protein